MKKVSMKTNHKTRTRSAHSKVDASQALRKLFTDAIKDIYWAEKALVKAVPKILSKVSSPELTEAMSGHHEETLVQVKRLESVFEKIGEKVSGKKCEAMVGLIREAMQIMSETEEGPVRDAGIILAAQKIEHYEIATYGTLIAFARLLEEQGAEELLLETLEEEKLANEKLTMVAETSINIEAAEETEI